LPKSWVGTFPVRSVQSSGKDFELILTVKMETRHPVDGQFVVNFGLSVIIAESWRPEVARPGNFVSNFGVWKSDSLR